MGFWIAEVFVIFRRVLVVTVSSPIDVDSLWLVMLWLPSGLMGLWIAEVFVIFSQVLVVTVSSPIDVHRLSVVLLWLPLCMDNLWLVIESRGSNLTVKLNLGSGISSLNRRFLPDSLSPLGRGLVLRLHNPRSCHSNIATRLAHPLLWHLVPVNISPFFLHLPWLVSKPMGIVPHAQILGADVLNHILGLAQMVAAALLVRIALYNRRRRF
jgi:hypothetical protein